MTLVEGILEKMEELSEEIDVAVETELDCIKKLQKAESDLMVAMENKRAKYKKYTEALDKIEPILFPSKV